MGPCPAGMHVDSRFHQLLNSNLIRIFLMPGDILAQTMIDDRCWGFMAANEQFEQDLHQYLPFQPVWFDGL